MLVGIAHCRAVELTDIKKLKSTYIDEYFSS